MWCCRDRSLCAARAGGWADGWRGAGGGGVGDLRISGAPPGAQIRPSRGASAHTRRAARARGGGGCDWKHGVLPEWVCVRPTTSLGPAAWRIRCGYVPHVQRGAAGVSGMAAPGRRLRAARAARVQRSAVRCSGGQGGQREKIEEDASP
eukprot:gene25213-biopygen15012